MSYINLSYFSKLWDIYCGNAVTIIPNRLISHMKSFIASKCSALFYISHKPVRSFAALMNNFQVFNLLLRVETATMCLRVMHNIAVTKGAIFSNSYGFSRMFTKQEREIISNKKINFVATSQWMTNTNNSSLLISQIKWLLARFIILVEDFKHKHFCCDFSPFIYKKYISAHENSNWT